MRFVVFLLSSLAAWHSTPAWPDSVVFRRYRWTMHDPGLPVKINVAPSQDELLAEQRAMTRRAFCCTFPPLLDVFVVFPEGFSSEEVLVTMSFFEPSSGNRCSKYSSDSQVQYVTEYRDWQHLDSYGFAQDDFTALFTFSLVLQPSASCDQNNGSNTAPEEHAEL
ncbi:hypothetical protein GQ600_9497 [Phytophthora cactorum]|nr:hypothetical protein GQ600_9497 [Phytophthora cactorum]